MPANPRHHRQFASNQTTLPCRRSPAEATYRKACKQSAHVESHAAGPVIPLIFGRQGNALHLAPVPFSRQPRGNASLTLPMSKSSAKEGKCKVPSRSMTEKGEENSLCATCRADVQTPTPNEGLMSRFQEQVTHSALRVFRRRPRWKNLGGKIRGLFVCF